MHEAVPRAQRAALFILEPESGGASQLGHRDEHDYQLVRDRQSCDLRQLDLEEKDVCERQRKLVVMHDGPQGAPRAVKEEQCCGDVVVRDLRALRQLFPA